MLFVGKHLTAHLHQRLQFMHENRVAHRYIFVLSNFRNPAQLDCSRDMKSNNLMIESEKMFPEGYHSLKDLRKPDLSGPAIFYTRTQRPSKYFIIDFGMSRRYEPDNDSPVEATITEKGVELQNPFQVDVHLAGELLRQVFLDVSQASSSVVQIVLTTLGSPRFDNHSWILRL